MASSYLPGILSSWRFRLKYLTVIYINLIVRKKSCKNNNNTINSCFVFEKGNLIYGRTIIQFVELNDHTTQKALCIFLWYLFFRAKSTFVSVIPHDFWEGWNHIVWRFTTHQEKISLDNANTHCLEKNRGSACTGNKPTFIFVSMQDSFFPHNYSLKSKQSSIHLLRRSKGKDLIIE